MVWKIFKSNHKGLNILTWRHHYSICHDGDRLYIRLCIAAPVSRIMWIQHDRPCLLTWLGKHCIRSLLNFSTSENDIFTKCNFGSWVGSGTPDHIIGYNISKDHSSLFAWTGVFNTYIGKADLLLNFSTWACSRGLDLCLDHCCCQRKK